MALPPHKIGVEDEVMGSKPIGHVTYQLNNFFSV